jgi:hypothetical protein
MTLVPDLRDPNFQLNISAAVFYRIPNLIDETTNKIISYKNNYGINAQTSVNLRTINSSDGSSQLLGAITNVRKDMMNLYIKGWSCFQGDNQAIDVSLLNPANAVIQTKSSYIYPYMVPHGTPIDSNPYWPLQSSDFDLAGRAPRPYLANGIEVVFDYANIHKSGVEANPTLIDTCKTITAAHGFELIIPLARVQTLNQQQVRVEASLGVRRLILRDAQGRSDFFLPEVRGLINTVNSFLLNRGSENFTSSGSVCSDSPAPMEVEVSFTYEDFRLALLGQTQNGLANGTSGFVHIPAYGTPTVIYQFGRSPTNTPQIQRVHSLSSWGEGFLKYYNFLTAFRPNAYIDFESNAAYTQAVNNLDIRRVGTGEAITVFNTTTVINDYGNSVINIKNQDRANLVTTGVIGISDSFLHFWDYYDVGSPFSTMFVGYKVNLDSDVGRWLNQTYGIKSILREVKKYETPLKASAHILTRGHLSRNGQCAGNFRHDFSVQANNYITFAPAVNKITIGHWIDPSNPTAFVTDELSVAMRKVPLTYRFYQDGKLIKHIVTDFGQAYTEVNYNF